MRANFIAFAILALLGTNALAADIAGVWRSDALPRRALKIERHKSGYAGSYYLLDDDPSATPISLSATKTGVVKFRLISRYSEFEGKLSAGGGTLSGTWTTVQGKNPLTFVRADPAFRIDPAPHRILNVEVEKGVSLEVLDFGGTGRPILFIPGSGNSAHIFDGFAQKFVARHHVYAMTRRGWGGSSVPPPTAENYDADREGDDVLAVLSALKIEKPVLAGHSFAGQELSSIGSRFPDRVAGLIYLEAGYEYAFYNPELISSASVEADALRRELAALVNLQPSQWPAATQALREDMARLDKHLAFYDELSRTMKDAPPKTLEQPGTRVTQAMEQGMHAYSATKPPILAIYAAPKRCTIECSDPGYLQDMRREAEQIDAVEKSHPEARLIRIAHASHFIFRSNADDVAREMNSFMDGLPAQ